MVIRPMDLVADRLKIFYFFYISLFNGHNKRDGQNALASVREAIPKCQVSLKGQVRF
jgi:hypothetical protein